jgi:ABC transporter substrate binding protein (PQQ-dependent alcohol dehydrogenase system)
MIAELRRALVILFLVAAAGPVQAAEREPFDFVYIMREAETLYEPRRAYTGLRLRDRHRPVDGARVALRESKVLGRALGLRFSLAEERLAPEAEALDHIRALMSEGRRIFLLDLPLAETAALGRALAGEPLLLFNIRHRSDALRGADCSPVLFHTPPSDAMVMDALAQYLVAKSWREILVLRGALPRDAELAEVFAASARKFGLEIVETRDFELGNDPRRRDRNNIALLTSGVDYDVVFLADSFGELGRYVPFATQDPRPVVGSEGLVPSAWHWTWERHGAPQLNQRFDKRAGRRMTAEDWAGWAAVKLVVEALSRSESRDPAVLSDFLRGEALTFDAYKGEPGSFRPWDNQLRQQILLHSHNAVIARAPIEGFLHQHNVLDSLGADERDSACRMP